MLARRLVAASRHAVMSAVQMTFAEIKFNLYLTYLLAGSFFEVELMIVAWVKFALCLANLKVSSKHSCNEDFLPPWRKRTRFRASCLTYVKIYLLTMGHDCNVFETRMISNCAFSLCRISLVKLFGNKTSKHQWIFESTGQFSVLISAFLSNARTLPSVFTILRNFHVFCFVILFFLFLVFNS